MKCFLALFATLALAADTPANLRSCAQCHPAQAKPHPLTGMAHAIETIAECTILRENPLLNFKSGPYSYSIKRDGFQSLYTVTDGVNSITVPIGWAFGLGVAGQTYVYQYQGSFYESRVSFYRQLQGLDFTMGTTRSNFRNLVDALGRKMPPREGIECFNCHSTNSITANKVDVAALTPGVQCERCHGPTETHLAAFKTGNPEGGQMKKLDLLNAEEMNNFCGQCHRTWEQIAADGPHSVGNVRFQPYRLTNSKCYDAEDRRIRCVACHDPHLNLVRDNLSSYDSRCLACHASAKHCPVATQNCVSCHMPKTELPGSHHQFTDHQIRIARANAPYPP
ncbi:MAG: multiheme c-type cytochrome [Bryobacteraceae bacterium]